MTFTNDNVDITNIGLENLELNPISPRYRVINMTLTAVFALLVCAVLFVLQLGIVISISDAFSDNAHWAMLFVATLALLNMGYHFFADKRIKYAVREQDVHFQAGLFFRRIVSQPILRIQHIELKRGPIERKAGLATLQVFSAGGMSHTFEIPGLEFDKAASLRQFIINHKDLTVDE